MTSEPTVTIPIDALKVYRGVLEEAQVILGDRRINGLNLVQQARARVSALADMLAAQIYAGEYAHGLEASTGDDADGAELKP